MRSILVMLSALLLASTNALDYDYKYCAGETKPPPSPTLGPKGNAIIMLSSRLGKVEGIAGLCPNQAIVPKSSEVYSRYSGVGITGLDCISCCELNCGRCFTADQLKQPMKGYIQSTNQTIVERIEFMLLEQGGFGCFECKDGAQRIIAGQQDFTSTVAAGVFAGEPEQVKKKKIAIYKCPAATTATPSQNTTTEPKPPVNNTNTNEEPPGGENNGGNNAVVIPVEPDTDTGGKTGDTPPPEPNKGSETDTTGNNTKPKPNDGGSNTGGGTKDNIPTVPTETTTGGDAYNTAAPVQEESSAATFSVALTGYNGDPKAFEADKASYVNSVSSITKTPAKNIKATATQGKTDSNNQDIIANLVSPVESIKGHEITVEQGTKHGRLLKDAAAIDTDRVVVLTAILTDTPEQVLLTMSKSANDGTLEKTLKAEGCTMVPGSYKTLGVVEIPKNATDTTAPASAAFRVYYTLATVWSTSLTVMVLF